MIATLTFDMEEPSERKDLKLKLMATDLAIAIWDIEQMFRNELKYNEDITDEQYQIVEKLQQTFIEIGETRQIFGLIE